MTWDDLLAHRLAEPGACQDGPWEGDVVVPAGPEEGPPRQPLARAE